MIDAYLNGGHGGGGGVDAKGARQVAFEVKTFLLAGHETTSAMLTWALHEMTGQAGTCERVAAEAHSVFPGGCLPEGHRFESRSVQKIAKFAHKLFFASWGKS